jgi:hypothetical protein
MADCIFLIIYSRKRINMTYPQFKRLLIISFIPLLIFGYILSKTQSGYVSYITFCDRTHMNLCISDILKESDFPLESKRLPRAHTGFWVQYPRHEVDYAPLMLLGTVLDVSSPFSAPATSPDILVRYEDRIGTQQFFPMQRKRDTEFPDRESCHEMRWTESKDIYQIVCALGDKGSVMFDVQLRSDLAGMMQELRTSAEESRRMSEKILRSDRITILFIPIALFLILSLVVWLVVGASRFVRTGRWRVS